VEKHEDTVNYVNKAVELTEEKSTDVKGNEQDEKVSEKEERL